KQNWRHPSDARLQEAANYLKSDSFGSIARGFLGLRDNHPALVAAAALNRPKRVATSLWFTVLEQRFLNREQAVEIARAWIIFERIWPRRHAGTSLRTAMDSVGYSIALSMAALHGRGFIPDLRQVFAGTTLKTTSIDTIVEQYTAPAEEILAQ